MDLFKAMLYVTMTLLGVFFLYVGFSVTFDGLPATSAQTLRMLFVIIGGGLVLTPAIAR